MNDERLELRQIKLFIDICNYIGLEESTYLQMLDDCLLNDGMSYEDIECMDDITIYQIILDEINYNANYYLENGRNELIK